jgi:hypothetical protein
LCDGDHTTTAETSLAFNYRRSNSRPRNPDEVTMFTTLKRIAFAVSVPAALALGGWVQWTTLKTDAETVGIPTVVARVEVVRDNDRAQPPVPAGKATAELAQANAVTYPRINPAPSPDRTARDGATGQAERPTPAVKANTESAQANPAPPDPSIAPAPTAERRSEEKAELAQQQPPTSSPPSSPTISSSANGSSTTETKERQAAVPRETQKDRSARNREREGESRRSKNDATTARKVIVAKRQKAEQARHQWNGPAALALRDHPMLRQLRALMASDPAMFGSW